MPPSRCFIILLLILALLSACAPAAPSPAPLPTTPPTPLTTRIVSTEIPAISVTPLPATPSPAPTATPTIAPTATLTPSATPTLAPDFWKHLPIVPVVSPRAREIYRRGIQLGNNPAAFSKVGDCESTSTWFLSMFDGPPTGYDLAQYSHLAPVIAAFPGSWQRNSLAVKAGYNTTSVMTALWADPKLCQSGETPLECEFRLHRPAFALIMLGSNNAAQPERFEPQLRALLDATIQRGIVPILSTKADNLEGDDSINAAIARLALEYDIPLWNFWAAVQPLPSHGLDPDGAHLTLGLPDFDDPYALQSAWTHRNLTALQVLDAVWQAVQE